MLLTYLNKDLIEAGCDEAGRGCLAGSVYAAAVILPPGYENEELNDSKQLSARRRYALRERIQHDALAWAVGVVTAEEIDQINILNASQQIDHIAVIFLMHNSCPFPAKIQKAYISIAYLKRLRNANRGNNLGLLHRI